jgi:serine/threonine-protein kinase
VWPEVLPDNQTVLFTVVSQQDKASDIAVLSLKTGEQRVLLQNGSSPHYSSTGHLLFGRAGTLFAVNFNAARLEILGEPVPVQDGVATNPTSGAVEASFASNGTLVYLTGTNTGVNERRLVWVDSAGHETPVPVPPRAYDQAILSRDGTHAALHVEGDDAIWIADLTRGTLERLPTNGGRPHVLFFSVDAKRVASDVTRDGRHAIVWQRIDGADVAEPLVNFDGSVGGIPSAELSPDGTQLVAAIVRRTVDIGVAAVGDPNSYRDFLATPAREFTPAISPDGRWIAYTSDESGGYEIYVQRFPEGGSRVAIVGGGGVWPLWSGDGSALTYLSGLSNIERVPVTGLGAATLSFGTPTELFPYGHFKLQNYERQFAMTADGERFLMITADQRADARLVLVQNWADELKRLVPTK